jgi:hypothetical protein
MPAEFSDIRISFIWVETVLEGLRDMPRPGARLALLNDRISFAPFFEKARKQPVPIDDSPGISLQAPWPKPTGQRFWQPYLDQTSPSSVSGEQAWKSLVPLRAKLPFPITSSAVTTVPLFDVFFYPCGLALLGTVRLSANLPLEAAVEEAFKIKRDKIFNVEWPAGLQQLLSLDAVAERALDAMRNWAWGEGSVAQRTDLDAFTIFTFTQGKGVDLVPISKTPDIQRALAAVTNWRPSWKTDPLADLEKARVSSHKTPAAEARSLIYGGKRSRALWFPDLFAGSPTGSSLACYHRNLSQASLQVETLCGFARETAQRLADNKVLSFFETECTRNTAGILGRVYGGKKSYRSWSLRAQIDNNDFVDDINAIRAFASLTPLA